jgi:hypothetical protein
MSSQLKATDLISVATDMTNAFIGAAVRAAGAKDFEQREFAQLIEDIHRYQLEFRHGRLSQRDAQELIDDAVQDTQSTLATATAMRQDAITGAMNAAINVLSQAIRTTLNAAFAGFAFTL